MAEFKTGQVDEKREGNTEWCNVCTIHRNIVKTVGNEKTYTPDMKIDEETGIPRYELCSIVKDTAHRLNMDTAILTKQLFLALSRELEKWKSKKSPTIVISLK